MTDGERRYYLYRLLKLYLNCNVTRIDRLSSTDYRTNILLLNLCKSSDVVVTDESVNSFKTALFEFIDEAQKEIPDLTLDDILKETGGTLETMINNCFSILGITLNYTAGASTLNFNNSSGGTIASISGKTFLHVLTNNRQEISYALKTKDVMSLSNLDLIDISNAKYMCGVDSWIIQDTPNYKFTIVGSGVCYGLACLAKTYCNIPTAVYTVIIDKNITKLENMSLTIAGESAGSLVSVRTFVFMHDENDPLQIVSGAFPSYKSSGSNKLQLDIYSDNPAVSNYSFGSNIDARIHPLSEWEG